MDVIISGNSIRSVADFHEIIKRQLNFPEYYGENLDALWDCVRCVELPCKLIWEDHKTSREHLSGYFDKIRELFDEAEMKVEGFKIVYK